MKQPLQAMIEDTFSTKETNTDKGAVTSVRSEIKAAFGEVMGLKADWRSEVTKSHEEEEDTYVQRSSVSGKIKFPPGALLRYDENGRILYFEVVNMDFNKKREDLPLLELSDKFLRS